MSFPRYPNYKDSGVEWLGEVPEHWGVKMLKWFSTLQRGHDLTEIQQEEGSYPVVTSGGITGKHNIYIIKGPGIVTGRYGSTGRLFYIEDHFWPHNTTLYVSNFHENDVRFAWYALHIIDYSSHSAKSAVPGIDRNDLHVLSMAVPPLDEQANIAAFLDQETAKIDALVAEQQRLIDLLKEKRQAVISHAVTKGLDPTVPMKPSGIEWLGEVPENWTKTRLRNLFWQEKRQDQSGREVLSVYRDYGVIPKNSRDDNINKTPDDLSLYQLVNPGDLVINKMKAWQGSLGISRFEGITSPDYVVFSSKNPEYSSFLHLLLRSQPMVSVYLGISNGIRPSQWRLEPGSFLSLYVFLPPTQEQKAIAGFIDRNILDLDTLTAEAERAIELLQERRTALISAAVTGQIDVRQLAQGVAA